MPRCRWPSANHKFRWFQIHCWQKKLTGFTNEEEAINKLTDDVPFLAEDSLKAAGAVHTKAPAYTEKKSWLMAGLSRDRTRSLPVALAKRFDYYR